MEESEGEGLLYDLRVPSRPSTAQVLKKEVDRDIVRFARVLVDELAQRRVRGGPKVTEVPRVRVRVRLTRGPKSDRGTLRASNGVVARR